MASSRTTRTCLALSNPPAQAPQAPAPQAARAPLTLRELDEIDVRRIKGVGSRRGDVLAAVGIKSVFDLLTHYPRDHEDRTREGMIDSIQSGDKLTVTGEITKVQSRRTGPGGRKTLVEAKLDDGTGVLTVVFFNQPWRKSQLTVGEQAAMFGTVAYRGKLQMTNPKVDLIGNTGNIGNTTGVIVSVYPQSPKVDLMSPEITRLVSEALRRCEDRGIADPMPSELRQRLGLLDRHTALRQFHKLETLAQKPPALRRLQFDELMRMMLLLRRDRLEREKEELGIPHSLGGDPGEPADLASTASTTDAYLWSRFTEQLSFRLTAAQQNAIADIESDMSNSRPMHRLLQGDVGSGKTIVAARVLLAAVANGKQGALMVPTEVLAEQHYLGLNALLKDLEVADDRALGGKRPLQIALLTGSLNAKAHTTAKDKLRTGAIDVVVGTHALIQEAVEFHDLTAVVVDEQHRFGVEQRSRLRESGRTDNLIPHLLVMTATPIPRTAAMTLYGDLDISALKEMPPGRTPIETHRVDADSQLAGGSLDKEKMWKKVREQVAAGQQAFVVCPLIEDSEEIEASSAKTTYDQLCANELAGLNVGLLHGRLASDQKEKAINSFHRGAIDVLVSTTVIEVGVDVPNATVMVILSADRFGMAQLHQLRGRVGRGVHASHCYLVVEDEITDFAERRLAALVATTDGFKLAEADLKLRGEGTLFDESQSGRGELKLASLVHDRKFVEKVRDEAVQMLRSADDLETQPQLAGYADEIDWFVERREGLDETFLQRG